MKEDKNNMRELNLQVCARTYQLNMQFDLSYFFFKPEAGGGKKRTRNDLLNHKNVQDNLLERECTKYETVGRAKLPPAEDTCKTRILFCKALLHNVSLPVAPLKLS